MTAPLQIAKTLGGDQAAATPEAFRRLYAKQGYKLVGANGQLHLGQGEPRSLRATINEGQYIYALGHSWVANDFQNTPGARPIDRYVLRNTHQYSMLLNEARSGLGVEGVANRTIGDISAHGHLQFLADFAAWIDPFQNHVGYTGYTDATAKSSILESLFALLAFVNHETRIEETAMTLSGTWTASPDAIFSGGSSAFSSTPGAYAEVVVNVPVSGAIDVILEGQGDNSQGWPWVGADYEIRVDGVLVKTGTTANIHRLYTGTESRGVCPYAIPLTGLAPGNHTVRVTRAASSPAGALLHLDCIITRRQFLPNVLLWLTPRLPWPTLWPIYGIAPNMHHTTQDEVDAMKADVVAQVPARFPNVTIVDPDLWGWDMQAHLGADGAHANDRGAAFLCNLAEYMIATHWQWNPTSGVGIVT